MKFISLVVLPLDIYALYDMFGIFLGPSCFVTIGILDICPRGLTERKIITDYSLLRFIETITVPQNYV